jgi:alcohol dehydrogenase class IV
MPNDVRGLMETAASAAAVRAFDHAIEAYLTYRSDIMARLEALFAADPECGMAHVLKESGRHPVPPARRRGYAMAA